MTRVNAVNFTGLERFVVDQDPAKGNYTTIQTAIDAAALVGNGAATITEPTEVVAADQVHVPQSLPASLLRC